MTLMDFLTLLRLLDLAGTSWSCSLLQPLLVPCNWISDATCWPYWISLLWWTSWRCSDFLTWLEVLDLDAPSWTRTKFLTLLKFFTLMNFLTLLDFLTSMDFLTLLELLDLQPLLVPCNWRSDASDLGYLPYILINFKILEFWTLKCWNVEMLNFWNFEILK